jgi:magnesium chelatase subunit I
MSDLLGIIPAITGKIEVVYEGEQEGAAIVAENLIGEAVRSQFDTIFPKIEKLTKENDENPYSELLEWFSAGNRFELPENINDQEYEDLLDTIPSLRSLVTKYYSNYDTSEVPFIMEFILWSLTEYSKLGKDRYDEGFQFNDLFNSYLSDSLKN